MSTEEKNNFEGIINDYFYDLGYKYEWIDGVSFSDESMMVYVSIVYQEDDEQYTEYEEVSYADAIAYIEKQIKG